MLRAFCFSPVTVVSAAIREPYCRISTVSVSGRRCSGAPRRSARRRSTAADSPQLAGEFDDSIDHGSSSSTRAATRTELDATVLRRGDPSGWVPARCSVRDGQAHGQRVGRHLRARAAGLAIRDRHRADAAIQRRAAGRGVGGRWPAPARSTVHRHQHPPRDRDMDDAVVRGGVRAAAGVWLGRGRSRGAGRHLAFRPLGYRSRNAAALHRGSRPRPFRGLGHDRSGTAAAHSRSWRTGCGSSSRA